jgi:hypothetical protein
MNSSFNWASWLIAAARLVSVVAVAVLGGTAAADWQYGWWVVFGVVVVGVVLAWWLLRRMI